jgi:hypothetical protein
MMTEWEGRSGLSKRLSEVEIGWIGCRDGDGAERTRKKAEGGRKHRVPLGRKFRKAKDRLSVLARMSEPTVLEKSG